MNGTHSMSQRVVSWQADSIVLPVVLLIVLLIVLAARPGDSQLASRPEDPAVGGDPIDIGLHPHLPRFLGLQEPRPENGIS